MKRLMLATALAVWTAQHVPRPPAQTFRATVAGVTVAVAVRDGSRGVRGLGAGDFVLTDNGVPQTISAVSMESTPIDLALLIDTSTSVRGPMLERFKADIGAVSGLLEPADRTGVITFSSSVRETAPLHGRDDGRPAVALAPAGSTAFYHAVVTALLAPSTPGRPHLSLVLSDGDDNSSFLDGGDLRALASRSETVLFLVLRGTVNAKGSRVGWLAFRGPGALDDLKAAAETTGGELRREGVDADTTALFKRVIDDFKAGYVLRYTPAGVEPRGWHEIGVSVKNKKYVVRARRGYFGE